MRDGIPHLTRHDGASTIAIMDAVARFMDEVGRMADAEVLRVAGQSRRHDRDKAVEAARVEARGIVRRAGQDRRLQELTDALRKWAAYNDAVGELAADLSMRPRVQAYPVLADALLAVLAEGDLDQRSRAALLADWASARPTRFANLNVDAR